jgi:hypothetical protein
LVGLVAVAAFALGCAWLMQGVGGYPQNSQYALVRALAQGTPNIDRTRHEVGELGTLDARVFKGHYYSNKAPGLAFLLVPEFLVLKGLGVTDPGPDPSRILWALTVLGAVLPAAALLVLVRRVVDVLEPGAGVAAAVTLGLATPLLPYATLLYNHVLAALLAFGTFAVLFLERQTPGSIRLVLAAGLVAGLAVTSEYANALAVGVLALYAVWRAQPVRRALAFAAGGLAGILPLVLYNLWAFGAPLHNTYGGRALEGDTGVRPTSRTGADLAGRAHPHLNWVLENLFSTMGLLTLAPVLACSLVGAWALWRRGRRAEVAVCLAIPAAFLLFTSSYGSAFSGFGPGPRYVIPAFGFLAVLVGVSYRVLPLPTLALGLVSALAMVSVTATHALAGYDWQWFHRIGDRQLTPTAASLVGITGWYAALPFFAAAMVAGVAAVLALAPGIPSRAAIGGAGVAVLAWAFVTGTATQPVALGGRSHELSAYWAAYVVALVVLALLAAWLALGRRELAPELRREPA